MNKIYVKFYKQKLFTLQEANKVIKNLQVCKNTLKRLITKNLIKRVRHTVYYIVPLDDIGFYPNRLEIAAKLRDDGIIACNSALLARNLYTIENTVYILSDYASGIRIKETTYRVMENPEDFGTEEIDYDTGYNVISLRLTDIERTIIDCLRTRSMKAEDLINILRTSKIEISMKRIMKYLEKFRKPILYNKTGFVLELAKDNLKITDPELADLKKKLTKKIYYHKEKGLRLIKPRYKYFVNWNIMIPESLFGLTK